MRFTFVNFFILKTGGISWDNSMCNRTYSCSVVEGKTFRSVMTAVHEIGHSLGMEHDGARHNFKCPPGGYIMSHLGGGEEAVGKIAWSPCSKHNLRAFLTTAPNVLTNQVACLNNMPRKDLPKETELSSVNCSHSDRESKGKRNGWMRYNNRYNLLRNRGGKMLRQILPGSRFSVTAQCQLAGQQWHPSKHKMHIKVNHQCRNTN